MAGELAGSQISALLEAVPGIANVLRSPVADALVNLVRAGVGLGEFRYEDAEELVHYAVRRGLLGSAEGEKLLQEVQAKVSQRQAAKGSSKKAGKSKAAKPKAAARRSKARAAAKVKAKRR
jgi:polyhydroxyalkanoate synthesis regulator phasin